MQIHQSLQPLAPPILFAEPPSETDAEPEGTAPGGTAEAEDRDGDPAGPTIDIAGALGAPLPPAELLASAETAGRHRAQTSSPSRPGVGRHSALHPAQAAVAQPTVASQHAAAVTAPAAAVGAAVAVPSGTAPVAGAAAGAPEAAPVEPATAEPPSTGAAPGAQELTEEEQRQVEELRARDREVRQHEQAHMAAAGGYARGGPQYEYTTGPDNKRYATGGEVSIDTSEIPNDPAATIRKAQVIYRAAMAPAEPSGQDRQVAAEAKQMEAEARRELVEQRREEMGVAGGGGGEAAASGDAATTAEEAGAAGAPGGEPASAGARGTARSQGGAVPTRGAGSAAVPDAGAGAEVTGLVDLFA